MDLTKYFVKSYSGWYRISGDDDDVKKQIKSDINQYDIDTDSIDDNGNTILHILCDACVVDAIILLLAKYSDMNVNVKNKEGNTPLHVAANSCRGSKVVKILIDNFNVNVNSVNKRHETPLYLSCKSGHSQTVEVLINNSNVDINMTDNYGRTPLYIACDNENIGCVNALIQHRYIDLNKANDDGNTPLMAVIGYYNHDYVELLLGLSSNIRHVDQFGSDDTLKPKYYPNIDDNPININQTDNDGNTALHIACRDDCNYETIWILLDHPKLDINKVNKNGYTPLMLAFTELHFDLAQPLLTCDNINVNTVNSNNDTLIHICCHMATSSSTTTNNIITTIKNSYVSQEAIKSIIFHPNLDINAVNYDGDTALHIAVNTNNIFIIKLLLSHPKIDINKPDSLKTVYKNLYDDNNTNNSDSDSGSNYSDDDEDNKLTTFNSHVGSTVKDKYDTTPLMLACSKGYNDIIELLLSHPGINIHITDSDGCSAITYAQKFCSPSIKTKLSSMC